MPVSLLRALGGDTEHEALLPPVDPDILPPDALERARVVVLIVIDGLSAAALARDQSGFADCPPAVAQTITSVFPSTTAAALTSLHYGASPATHGMAGYTIYLPAIGRVINLVRFKPVDGSTADPTRLDPRGIVRIPTVFERLRDEGVGSVIVSHQDYASSPLTLAQSRDTEFLGHRTPAEFATRIMEAIEWPGRRLIFSYWAGLDMLCHTWGPQSDAARLDLRLLQRAIVEGVLGPVSQRHRDVVVVLTADHGHTVVAAEQQQSLSELARLVGGWTAPPTGERRAVGLSTAVGRRANLVEAVDGRGVVVPVAEAMLHGLFGPPPHHPELLSRVGDLMVLARQDASFPYREHGADRAHKPGAHGSLSSDEMLVPLLLWRFDG